MPAESKLLPFNLDIHRWRAEGYSYSKIVGLLSDKGVKVSKQAVGKYCKVRSIDKFDKRFLPAVGRLPEEVELESNTDASESDTSQCVGELEQGSKEVKMSRAEEAKARIDARRAKKDKVSFEEEVNQMLEDDKKAEIRRIKGE